MKGTEGAVSSVETMLLEKIMLLETYRIIIVQLLLLETCNCYCGDNNSGVIIAQFIRHIGALGTIWQ